MANVGTSIRLTSTLLAFLLCVEPGHINPTRDALGVTPAGLAIAATASKPWQPEARERAWKYIVLHHTASESGDVESIDRIHRQRKDSQGRPWRGIGYHFVIGNGQPMANGAIEPTFRWQQQLAGAHSGDRPHNDSGIGICLVGDFTEHAPSEEQIASLQRLIKVLRERYQIDSKHVLTHREIRDTECPGKRFPYRRVLGRDAKK